MSKYPFVLLEWCDARSINEWQTPEDIDTSLILCYSAGWLIHEGDATTVIAGSRAGNLFTSMLVIPSDSIRKRTDLRADLRAGFDVAKKLPAGCPRSGQQKAERDWLGSEQTRVAQYYEKKEKLL